MDAINDLFTSYIGLISLVVVIVLLFLISVIFRQRKDHPKDLIVHEKQIEARKERKKEQVKPIPSSSTPIQETQQIPKPADKTKRLRKLKPHGAITKDDFTIFAGSKLLIAEDNLINQKVISGMIGESGIEIIMANNGQEALEILSHDKDIYLVLMDAHMPIVDGFEATEHIRADRSLDHVAVVALSGDTAADDIKKMKNVGMIEHLEKPLNIEKLYEMLYYYLDTVDGVKFNFSEANRTKYLDAEYGIEICGGDDSLFKEILTEFITMYADSEQTINSFISHNDLESAKRLLLDISGIAANIGAKELSRISAEFREILDLKNKESLQDNMTIFSNALISLITEIKSYLNKQ